MNPSKGSPQPQERLEQLGPGFQLLVIENSEEMSRIAAEQISNELRAKPNMFLCAATGSTPTRAYELLVEKKNDQASLFQSLRLLKLDEWGELPMDDAGSCETYLQKHLVRPLEIPSARYLSFQSEANSEAECARITEALAEAGPLDLCILGLGVNGHLGFNEPADALQPMPHRAELSSSSLQHSMIRQAKTSLKYGLTIGMAHLLQSKKILLLVNGIHKAPAMRQLLSGRISTHFPASFLWLHPHVICICDRDAVASDSAT